MEMLTRVQADLIATAIRVVRPAWAYDELMGTLSHDDIRNRRGYADTFHALLELALDRDTNHPNRLLAAGPWWSLRGVSTNTSDTLPVIDFATACDECLKPFEHLWHGGTGTIHDHEFRRPNPAKQIPEFVREHTNERPNHADV